MFSMQKIVAHVCKAITNSNIEKKTIELDTRKPIKSTGDMRPWSTIKHTELVTKSHINLAVYDSGWEIKTGQFLERDKRINSWVRNDHVGFIIKYLYNGLLKNYIPDFLIRLNNDVTLVLEVKGKDSDQNKEKRRYLAEWVDVVNEDGNYGIWASDVILDPAEIRKVIEKHTSTEVSAKVFAKCPKCGKTAKGFQDVQKDFGFRNMDGIMRPQSWCRICRKK